mmetsp:Transcript_122945/g.353156  ORF Transcript_122945/g.353156 Transcript_122945/m.353156 type:complete len:376 (-) Transcript_122945:975-2102(-)
MLPSELDGPAAVSASPCVLSGEALGVGLSDPRAPLLAERQLAQRRFPAARSGGIANIALPFSLMRCKAASKFFGEGASSGSAMASRASGAVSAGGLGGRACALDELVPEPNLAKDTAAPTATRSAVSNGGGAGTAEDATPGVHSSRHPTDLTDRMDCRECGKAALPIDSSSPAVVGLEDRAAPLRPFASDDSAARRRYDLVARSTGAGGASPSGGNGAASEDGGVDGRDRCRSWGTHRGSMTGNGGSKSPPSATASPKPAGLAFSSSSSSSRGMGSRACHSGPNSLSSFGDHVGKGGLEGDRTSSFCACDCFDCDRCGGTCCATGWGCGSGPRFSAQPRCCCLACSCCGRGCCCGICCIWGSCDGIWGNGGGIWG